MGRDALWDIGAILSHTAEVRAGVDEVAYPVGGGSVRQCARLLHFGVQAIRVVEPQLHGVHGVHGPWSGCEERLGGIWASLDEVYAAQGGEGDAFRR